MKQVAHMISIRKQTVKMEDGDSFTQFFSVGPDQHQLVSSVPRHHSLLDQQQAEYILCINYKLHDNREYNVVSKWVMN